MVSRIQKTFGPLYVPLSASPVSETAMLYYKENTQLPSTNAMYCIGTFDGVHRGHANMIREAKVLAAERGLATIAHTFNPRPQDVLSPNQKPYLTNRAASVAYLLASGADAVLVETFTKEVAHISYANYLDMLKNRVPYLKAIIAGPKTHFGYGAQGRMPQIADYAAQNGLACFEDSTLIDKNLPISSSRIRVAIAAGELERANELLGRDFYIEGEVIRGKGEGKNFGFATANIALDPSAAILPEGVWAGYACVKKRVYPAAIQVGAAPSFDIVAEKPTHYVEAHLLGFDEDIYGETLRVAFVKNLRSSRAFKSIDELKAAVVENIEQVGELIGRSCLASIETRQHPQT